MRKILTMLYANSSGQYLAVRISYLDTHDSTVTKRVYARKSDWDVGILSRRRSILSFV